MFFRALALAATLALTFAGCATFSKEELAQMRQRGVPPRALERLQDDRGLEPPEIIALARNRVPPAALRRHLEDNGVDYLATSEDARRLRAAKVSPSVIEAMLHESSEFARQRYEASRAAEIDYWWWSDPLVVGWGPGWDYCW